MSLHQAFVSPLPVHLSHCLAAPRPPLRRTRWRASTAPSTAAATSATPSASPSTPFRKYHGLGNDFILVDNRSSPEPLLAPSDAVRICNRNTGVGGDGLIFLLPPTSPEADAQMRLYNSDGSEPEMCGNGIRCLARFAADLGVDTTAPGRIVVDTPAGTIVPEFVSGSSSVRVDMGPPILKAEDVPTTLDTSEGNQYTATMAGVAGKDWDVTAVSMGNPHAITFVDAETYAEVDSELERIGPLFESSSAFPAKTNTEFIRVLSPVEMDMVVWERGAGRTMACGTGACAVVVAAILTGRAQRDTPVTVHLPGGDLVIEWSSKDDHVFMTGPAELVFSGELHL